MPRPRLADFKFRCGRNEGPLNITAFADGLELIALSTRERTVLCREERLIHELLRVGRIHIETARAADDEQARFRAR